MADSTNLEMWQCNCWLEHNTHIYPYMGLNIQSSTLSFLSFDKVKAIASSTTGRLVARYTCPSSIGICHCYLCKEQRRKWASVEKQVTIWPTLTEMAVCQSDGQKFECKRFVVCFVSYCAFFFFLLAVSRLHEDRFNPQTATIAACSYNTYSGYVV